MEKKELREIIEVQNAEEHQLDEAEKKLILKRLSFPFAVGDVQNLNKRTYPSEILKRETEKMNQRIQDSKLAGQLEHPPDGLTRLGDVSHFIEKVEWNEAEKKGYGVASILATQKGNDVLTLLSAGLKMGISMRGHGTVDKDGRVENDYNLESIDIVTAGSFGKDVEISNLNLHESLNSKIEKEKKEKQEKQEKENITAYFAEARLAGYSKDFQAWKKTCLNEDLKKEN